MQLVRLALLSLTALALAHPASAQFGGLKKKLKKSSSQTDTTTSAPAADPTPAQGGSVVLTADVVSKLITGLQAGQAEREAAAKGDTKLMQIYQDSVSLLQGGPSCLVKDPSQPDGYYELERAVDVRGERAAV